MIEPSRWLQLRALFEEVMDLPERDRQARLTRSDIDPLLRDAVQRLLEADQARTGGGRPPAAGDDPGRSFGRYRLLACLGVGGMGEVHLAHDSLLDRRVAVKILSPKLTGDPQWLARFRREARAASALNHPNVLTIHDVGEVDGDHYIATEYVEGESLRQRLQRGRPSVSEAVDVAIQVAGGLATAHAAGVVHRDVKPENVMLRPDGLVKVVDFGVAKTMRPDVGEALDTAPGVLIGTMSYMAPEQARGLDVDARGDVFSLGVVLYEMLAGDTPFGGATAVDALVALLDRDPAPLQARNAQVVAELEDVVMRALHKDRAQRFATAAELLLALRSVPRGEAGAARQARAPVAVAETPAVRYARSGEVNIAYQVIGDAPLDLVFVMGWISHLEYFWSEPSFASFLRRLASFARVILFDKRGTGLSDRVPTDQLPTLEQRMDDVRAVMDAAGSQRAVLCGVSEGGPMCTLFAATYPEKTMALVMIGSYARRLRGDGYPWGPTLAEREAFFAEIRAHWGGPVGLDERAPSKAADVHFREWWAAYLRHGASPSAALALTRMNTEIDIRKVLPSVQVPTLVVHRRDDACLRVEEGRFLAEQIPGARFVELPGADHLPFVGDQDAILDQVEEFLTGMRPVPDFDRVLATVLLARVVVAGAPAATAAPAQLESYRAFVRRESGPFHGRPLEFDAQRLLTTFDGPVRAIKAACGLVDAARKFGLTLRVGLHTGECHAAGERVAGVAVAVAEQVAGRGEPGEVLVSSTVRDLVAGAGIRFVDRGTQARAGLLGELRVFAVERGAAV